MEVSLGRVTNPTSLQPSEIIEKLSVEGRVVVQFDHPTAYTPQVLQSLNDLCRGSSSNLQIRFYGHYKTGFDAAVLVDLPDVKNLSLDCLDTISNRHFLSSLQQLSALHFGVLDFDCPKFLEDLKLQQLTSLSLDENRKRNFDLTPLETCSSLERLSIDGHTKGIQAISSLANLTNVTLRYLAKTQSLAFLSEIPKLKNMKMQLGGRDDIAGFKSETLQTLQIIRVRGLKSLGNLVRFPRLQNLQIVDQIKLDCLDLTGVKLRKLHIGNCKSLKNITALQQQTNMVEFFASKTALNLEYLRNFHWPKTMREVGLVSNSRTWNEATTSHLKERGYTKNFQYWD